MGRPINPNSPSTRCLIERAAGRAERQILRQGLADIVPQIVNGALDVELGFELGANGGLREIEIGTIRWATARLVVSIPVENLATGRIAPLLVDAMVETLSEIRAAA